MFQIGEIIDGKYKILNVIGKGGMSIVYLAMNERANKQWAIKEVRKDGKQDFDVVKQGLVAEIGMLKRFNHPNLPSIVDVIDSSDTFLIVMDYIEGIALDRKLQEEGAQPQDEVIEWSKQLCDVLGYLHSRKPPIIYRDMKPANVMLKPDGTVVLIDFGTAREFKYSSVADTTCLGTRGYAAPEQFGGQGQTDQRTDIYCLGATMYHLVTGHNPGAYPYEMYPIRQWNALLSSGFEQIILKCTQQNPSERYQSCAELMYALEHYKELDATSQHIQDLKWKAFIGSAALAVVMAIASVGFNVGAALQSTDVYANKIVEAKNIGAQGMEPYELYYDAIKLKPAEPDAYNELLNYIIQDGNISQEESSNFGSITLGKEKEIFKKENPAAFSLFCYDVAMAYFFQSYGENTKERAGKAQMWLGEMDTGLIVEAGKKAGRKDYDKLQVRADNLKSVVKCANTEPRDPVTGVANYTPKEFWDSYVFLIDSNVESDSIVMALMIYKGLAAKIYDDPTFFAGDINVGSEVVKNKLIEIKTRINSYDPNTTQTYATKIEETLTNIDLALSALEAAGQSDRQIF